MKRRMVAFLALAALLIAWSPAQAQQSTPQVFDVLEEQSIREIVRQYLLDHPEVIIQSLEVYKAEQKLAEEERQREALKTQMAALTQDPDTPVIGNPEGDVVIVEFFDYRCGYCKRVVNNLRQVVEEDGNIRLVMKEFPILGPASEVAARAALASVKQDRYEEFHFAMMTARGQLNEASIMAIAETSGIDTKRLKQDMDADEISAMLQKNFELAQSLGIRGTPAFVIGDGLYPGALDLKTLKALVAQARAKSS
jgi:protein-disulfide isomerase